MKKKYLLSQGETLADAKIIRMAMTDIPRIEKLYNERISHYQYREYVKVRRIKGILQVSIYPAEYLRSGGKRPAYILYIDKKQDDFITYDVVYDKWRTACLFNINGLLNTRGKIFIGEKDQARISAYFGETDGNLETISRFQKKVQERNLERRYKKETDAWDRDMEGLRGLPKDWKRWLEKEAVSEHFIFYEYKKSGVKEGYCSWCEKTVPVKKPKYNKEGICPCCGRKVIYKSIKKCGRIRTEIETAYLIQRMKEKLILRRFSVYSDYLKDHYEKPGLYVQETERYIYEKDGRVKEYFYGNYKNRFMRWIKGSRTWNWYIYSGYGKTYFPPEKGKLYLKTIAGLEKYFLKKTGLRQFAKYSGRFDVRRYLETVKRAPHLEQIVKAGLYKLAEELVQKNGYFYGNSNKQLKVAEGTALTDILLLDKGRIRRLRRLNGGIQFCKWLQFEKAEGLLLSDELIRWFSERELVPEDMNFIAAYMSPIQIRNYLERKAREMGESIQDVLITWKDYLSMAKRLDIDISDAAVYRVRDLRKRHEEMVALIEKKNLEIRIEEILDMYPDVNRICNEIKTSRKYEFEDETYAIVVPNGIEDIFEDADSLQHCVNKKDDYFERINTRESFIVFLRRKPQIEKSYYTLEIEPDGSIRQERTQFNRKNPDLEDAREFLDRWQKEVQKRMSKEDRQLSERSRELRKQRYEKLRKDQVKIHVGGYNGKLLADILEEDLIEVLSDPAA